MTATGDSEPARSTSDRHGGLSGVQWGIAALVLLALGYLLAVALVRNRALARYDAELSRLRAAGEPLTQAEFLPPAPRAEDDAMAVLRTLSDAQVERLEERLLLDDPRPGELAPLFQADETLRAAADRARALGLDERGLFAEACGLAPVAAPRLAASERRTVLEAFLAPHEAELELVRAAARRPAVRATTYAAGSVRTDYARVLALARLLSLASVRAAERGDWSGARDDLRLALRFVQALDAQPLAFQLSLQTVALAAPADALARELALPEPGRELHELDQDLARFDPWPAAERAVRSERAHFVELIASARGSRPGGLQALWRWPLEEQLAADLLEACSEPLALCALRPEQAFADPRYHSPAVTRGSPLYGDTGRRLLQVAATQLQRIALCRAALRARFEGLESARTFLAGTLDVFSGAALGQRLESDGSLTLWGSSSPTQLAGTAGPGADDLVIRVPGPLR